MEDLIWRMAISIPGFLLGIVCHEAAHAYMALRFGDYTAKEQGRLSLNPLLHIDTVGTIIIPTISLMLGGIVFGYARPVPVNPRNYVNIRKGIFWVSFAGPLANLLVATIATLFLALMLSMETEKSSLYTTIFMMLRQGILINLVLFTFNLIPFPPLDGAKIVSVFLDYKTQQKFEGLGRYSMLFFIVLIATPLFRYLMIPALAFKTVILNIFLFLFTL